MDKEDFSATLEWPVGTKERLQASAERNLRSMRQQLVAIVLDALEKEEKRVLKNE